MKRHNIYIYDTDSSMGCKAVGFSRIDTFDNGMAKVFLQLNPISNIGSYCNININLLTTDHNYQSIEQALFVNLSSGLTFQKHIRILDNDIFGVSVELTYTSENKRILKGSIDGRICHPQAKCPVTEEPANENNDSHSTYKPIDSFKKLTFEDLLSMPTKYWCLGRNRFLICCYHKYGHFGLMNKDGSDIICVPGELDDKTSTCARRHGFKGYFPGTYVSKDDIPGYYYIRI